jgi:hypothetical protein
VIEPRHDLRLGLESHECVERAVVQHLDRDGTLELDVPPFVHGTHRTRAELGFDPIAIEDDLPDQRIDTFLRNLAERRRCDAPAARPLARLGLVLVGHRPILLGAGSTPPPRCYRFALT